MVGLVLADADLAWWHTDRQLLALRLGIAHHCLLQGHIQALLWAIRGGDEGGQPSQLQELTYHPHPRASQQGDHDVGCDDLPMQPFHPLVRLDKRRQRCRSLLRRRAIVPVL